MIDKLKKLRESIIVQTIDALCMIFQLLASLMFAIVVIIVTLMPFWDIGETVVIHTIITAFSLAIIELLFTLLYERKIGYIDIVYLIIVSFSMLLIS